MTDVNLKMLKDTDGNAFVPFSTTDAVFKDGTNQTVSDLLDGKQATLVSGTNIKTINGDSILGAGNITVSAEDEIAISTTEPTGNEILWIDPNKDLDAAAQILDGLPVGAECVYWGSTLPDTLLKEDGSQYDVDAYPELFGVIGHTFDLPSDNDSTKFRVPKHDGLTGVSIDTSDTDFNVIGKTGGSKYIQDHKHNNNMSGNEYVGADGWSLTINEGTQRSIPNFNDTQKTTGGVLTGTGGVSVGNSGNLQPYIVKQYCIKARSNSVNISEVKRATTTSDNDVYSCNYVNDHFGGEVLYNSDIGTSGTVTLSKSATNYTYLDIFFRTNDGSDYVGFVRVYSPNGKRPNLSYQFITGEIVYIKTKLVYINGTSITTTNYYQYYVGQNYGGGSLSDNILITRVVGYK